MLGIGGVGADCDGTDAELLSEPHEPFSLRFGPALDFLAQTFRQKTPDAQANQPVWQDVQLEPFVVTRFQDG